MTWDLKLYDCYVSVFHGPDQARRGHLFLELIREYSLDTSKRCLQVGAGHFASANYGPNWTSLDPFDKRAFINVREKLEETTLESNQFDLIICNAILEHVEDPFGCVKQMYRVAKPGCQVWCEVPFVQPFHPNKNWQLGDDLFKNPPDMNGDEDHGGDYWRFTPQGTRKLMEPFQMIEMLLINEGGIVFYGEKT